MVAGIYGLGSVIVGRQPNEWAPVLTQEEFDALESFCPITVGTLNASGNAIPPCGGPAGNLTEGLSFQRTGTTDTNTAADFTVGPQTRGAPN